MFPGGEELLVQVAAFRAWEGEGRPALGTAGSSSASREDFLARAADEVAAAGAGQRERSHRREVSLDLVDV